MREPENKIKTCSDNREIRWLWINEQDESNWERLS